MGSDNKVLDFISRVNDEKRKAEDSIKFKSSPLYRNNVLIINTDKGINDCLCHIFGKFYKQSIPLDNEYINTNNKDIDEKFKYFINKQTADEGLLCYIKEAIKNGNKSLETVLEKVTKLVKESIDKDTKENPEEIAEFRLDDERKSVLDEISKDASLDEVSEIVKNNVKDVVDYEKEKIRKRREEAKEIEDSLANDDDVKSESVIKLRLAILNRDDRNKSIYQPGLFESVLMNKTNENPSNDVNEAYNEAVCELTLLNMNKAMRFRSYNKKDVDKLALEYYRK